ncbi:MAG: hypothetical protein KGI29_01665 [Pseudomonadota bacterium]|nr:hypothetical protein [Pseudomonadota bacterium]MDE3037743.1 hypothetical protein [Pseudomonadota bacterium]
MSIYRYSHPGVIDEVTFRKTANGAMRAYLHAREGADEAALQDIARILTDADFECVPFMFDGKPTMEVRGFKRETGLLALLGRKEWIGGGPVIEQEKTDHIGLVDRLKKRTLQGSGALYTIGDYNFFRYGFKQSKWEEMLAGIMYGAGTLSLSAFGRNDQSDKQVRDLSRSIVRHLMKESRKLPKECGWEHILEDKNKSALGNTIDLFRHYPSEMFNLFTGLAGACVAAGAFSHKLRHGAAGMPDALAISRMKLSGWLDVGLGVMTMASTAIGGLVEEKAHDPDRPQEKGVQAVLDWARERPLTIAGAGLMVSTGCHAVSTYIDHLEARRLKKSANEIGAIKNRAWFVATNLAAEFLLAISSKGHGEGVVNDSSVDNSVIALAANLIVRQPPRMQNELVDYMAQFLGKPDVLAMRDEEVTALLRAQVEAMRKNPWAMAEDALPDQPNVVTPAKAGSTAWQDKIAAAPAAAPQLSA